MAEPLAALGSKIVCGVLKQIFGFLVKKARREVAKRFERGDFTDQECHRLIENKTDSIARKSDGLARKDLLSSFCFLQNGLNGIYQSVLQSPSDENIPVLSESVTTKEAASSRDTDPYASVNEAIALIKAIDSLKIYSNEHFMSAKEFFKLAYGKATEAFCNEELSIEDRIQACQIRMTARILGSLEDPDAGVSDCLQDLKQLHNDGTIRETFSVLIEGGLKSKFKETERINNASAVHAMNQILFDFARKFTRTQPSILTWPTIVLGSKTFERIYQPMFGDDRFVEKHVVHGVKVLSSRHHVSLDERVNPGCSVVNSKGEIVANIFGKGTLKIFKRSGETRKLCDLPRKKDARKWRVCAMDVDEEDNIYVITASKEREDEAWRFNLFIFDANGSKKHECPLPSVDQKYFVPAVSMAINKQEKIAILDCVNKMVYIGNVCVELNTYEVEKSFYVKEVPLSLAFSSRNIRFSHFNGIKIIVLGSRTIHIYTENGELEQVSKILEECGAGVSLAINHVTQRILIATWRPVQPPYYNLVQFSESGKLLAGSFGLQRSSDEDVHPALTSHLNGSVVVVNERGAAYLQ